MHGYREGALLPWQLIHFQTGLLRLCYTHGFIPGFTVAMVLLLEQADIFARVTFARLLKQPNKVKLLGCLLEGIPTKQLTSKTVGILDWLDDDEDVSSTDRITICSFRLSMRGATVKRIEQ